MLSLAKSEKIRLLELARKALERRVREGVVEHQSTDIENFKQPAGAFVTLHRRGELRGCIGRIQAVDPLEQVVQDMAGAAAVKDPRFSPVRSEEISEIEMEISVLSPFREVRTTEEIQIGRDGLMVSTKGYSGLLLPQVATEQGWDVETFLSHTCLKAGLDMDHWKNGTLKIEAFSAEIFSEKEMGVL